MAETPNDTADRSTGETTVPLEIISDRASRGRIRRSRNAMRRAVVLTIVQLLMIIHIVQWAVTGRSVSPVEPSESMQTLELGYVNAGFIFFAAALLATLIFGRFFCGWGCHLVLLQDLCAWIMKKVGVRPKPFRSRVLVYVPFVLALYMFVWPNFKRLGLLPILERWWPDALVLFKPVPEFPGFTDHLVTAGFWDSFAPWVVAIPFFFVCGFATVYFLGAKGFCTYGCPYGGFFAPLDEFAAGRIRVTDACEQCGHCTAVCTSNVRVHEEVREFGMVVDPGCMKCLDCVSVCPKDALYFGFGKPAQLKGAPRTARPRKNYDMTIAEEVVLTIVFVVAFQSWRGIYGVVPMLMAAGVAGIVTFLVWKAWRTMRNANSRLHRFQLRQRGAWTRGGLLFVVAVAVVVVLTAHSGAVNTMRSVAQFHDDQVTVPRNAIFSQTPIELPEDLTRHADAAIRFYRRTRSIGAGGIALVGAAEVESRLAWLHSCKLEFAEAEHTLRGLASRWGPREQVCLDIAELLHMQMEDDKALAYLQQVVTEEPGFTRVIDALAVALEMDGRVQQAIELCRTGLGHNPENLPLLRRLSLLLVDHDDVEEGIAIIRRTLEIDPTSAFGHLVLANALLDLDESDEVPELVRRAAEIAPENVQALSQASHIMSRMGRAEEAASYEQRARDAAERARRAE